MFISNSQIALDPDGDVPLYKEIAALLRGEIMSGRWKPGARIPTEKVLAKELGVSLGTLRNAILELVRAGLLHRQQGRGTFVHGARFNNSMTRFFRYTRRDLNTPLIPKTTMLKQALVGADEQVARAFGLTPGTQIAHVRRLRTFEDEPFLLHDSYFPVAVWERISGADFTVPSLYDLLQEDYDIHIRAADEYLNADVAKGDEADILNIPPGTAIVRLERWAYTFDEQLLEFRRSIGRGDHFRYHARL